MAPIDRGYLKGAHLEMEKDTRLKVEFVLGSSRAVMGLGLCKYQLCPMQVRNHRLERALLETNLLH